MENDGFREQDWRTDEVCENLSSAAVLKELLLVVDVVFAGFRVVKVVGMPTCGQDTSDGNPECRKGEDGHDPPHLDKALAHFEKHAIEEEKGEFHAPQADPGGDGQSRLELVSL